MLFLLVLGLFQLSETKISTKRIHASLDSWKAYKTEHSLEFEHKEDSQRLSVFLKNVKYINSFNKANSYMKLKVNKFAHLTREEFAKLHLSRPIKKNPRFRKGSLLKRGIDWRNKSVVNKVKDQKHCGSCWAFSAIGSLESHYAIKSKKLVSLSEQELVDCSSKYGNMGCDGGLMDQAFKYIMDKGISYSDQYPYKGKDQICHVSSHSSINVTDFEDVESGSEIGLTHAIRFHGPVSVAIDASAASFQFYSSGIYYEKSCSSYKLDHGVVAVGVYDKYYIVRNSWGEGWGDKGYIKMSRNRDNNCGIATAASYPVL